MDFDFSSSAGFNLPKKVHIHGFTQHLTEKLGVPFQPGEFKGDIHLSAKEKSWISQVEEITRAPVPFWIVAAGGKFDFTA